MIRPNVINGLLGLYRQPSYLEVGVSEGETFTQIKAARRVAVDPAFMFDTTAHAVPGVCTFHPVTSDVFFERIAPGQGRYDVIFLDGLHTFEQTLRDLMNALSFLKPGGAIVIDDVLPNSYDASLPDLAQVRELRTISPGAQVVWSQDGSWMGDVFRLVFFIQTFMPQFSYATVAETMGQMVLWQEVRAAGVPERTVETVARTDFRDTILGRAHFNVQAFETVLAQVAATVSRGAAASW